MPKNLRLFALTLGLATAAAFTALAQDTATPPATDTTTAPPADGAAATGDAKIDIPTAPATDLSIGTEAPVGLPTQAEAAANSMYLAATFDAWEQRCIKTEDGSDPCQLYQLLKDKDGNPVAEISLFDLPAGGEAAVGATVMVPLETLLTANLRIGVDKANPKIYPFTFCTKEGCLARIGFTAPELAALKKGVTGNLIIVPAVAPDQTVELAMSLKGFTAGYNAIKALTTAAPAATPPAP